VKKIVFYRDASGRCPAEEFLDSLTGKQAQKVVWVLRLIEDLQRVPTRYFRKLSGSDGIWEVRVKYAGDLFRLLGFRHGTDLVILNHAFRKKTQKTPLREIRLAEKRKRDYLAGSNQT